MTLATHIAVTKPVPAEDLYKLVDDLNPDANPSAS